ncbi:hypothetical protein ASJ35_14220 [Ruthenibacterium lactatiformans]|uniref:Uncharacterized protein n=1 Tax=Ruthenibacterium lactatiformans TaxID=1550024 RepID=A0A0W7TNG8_9FIRM|nr:hypothetical protein ASJ35_14220 [Ruthenibacterium lactatiformans]DAM64654.1 MAG TPA: hypothetical protein [Caudoviricetes sp.]
MTSVEFLSTRSIEILKIIQTHPRIDVNTLYRDYSVSLDELESLVRCRYVERPIYDVQNGVVRYRNEFSLTLEGLSALEKLEEHLRNESEEKAYKRRQEKIAVLQVLVPAITFILGLIVEHFSGIVALAFELFRNWVQ